MHYSETDVFKIDKKKNDLRTVSLSFKHFVMRNAF